MLYGDALIWEYLYLDGTGVEYLGEHHRTTQGAKNAEKTGFGFGFACRTRAAGPASRHWL